MHTIGIQGGRASYHEHAAQQLHPGTALTYYETFSDVFRALHSQQIGSAVLAIANNRIQFISDTYDELIAADNGLEIIGETYVRVEHALLAPAGASIYSITEVHSQAPALGQCGKFLEEQLPNARVVEQHDTAGSAKLVAEWNDVSKAAIASVRAGNLYGLAIIKEAIQDDPDNITRFLELAPAGTVRMGDDANKTTLLLQTPQTPGSLAKALLAFSERGINLSSLQSRVIPNTAFVMSFFLEFDAGLQEKQSREALKELKNNGYVTTVLGSYKRAAIPM